MLDSPVRTDKLPLAFGRMTDHSQNLAAMLASSWNPDGSGNPAAYEMYAPGLVLLIRNGAGADDLARQLGRIRTDRFEAAPDDARDAQVAASIIEWWASNGA